MRRRVEALADQLDELVSEDEHHAILVSCATDAVAFVGLALDLLDQRGGIDVTSPCFDRFAGEHELYASLVAWVEQFARTESLGTPVVPARGGLGERAHAAVAWLSEVVAASAPARVILALCPAEITDTVAYAAAAPRARSARGRLHTRIRLVVRDVEDAPLAARMACEGLRTLPLAIDTSPSAIREALLDEALDERNERLPRGSGP